ncbi:hypothetical protein PENTCL1PPCAC_19642, partial [Pristionchus entomophagus]
RRSSDVRRLEFGEDCREKTTTHRGGSLPLAWCPPSSWSSWKNRIWLALRMYYSIRATGIVCRMTRRILYSDSNG